MDQHSFARPEQVRVTHLDLELKLDFLKHVAAGSAVLDLERIDPNAPLMLDTSDLGIEAITDAKGKQLAFKLGEPDPIKGRPLAVTLSPDSKRIVVRYQTTPSSKAMQWLAPEQTAGKQPFLFTQGEAILTRSWIPVQDSPGVRITWNARILARDGLRPVMSATESAGNAQDGWTFKMPHPVPPYLIALACGDLQSRAISQRCAVWAEPAVIEAAANEFADLEKMVAACEGLFGPYRWGRYDVLVLPASFPFGGMENPCLTFATPTVLAGDRSLVSLIAHELSHSWSGNLVTNATWSDFWLNEGFTVYLERRIVEAVYGKDRADMETVLGMQNLAKELKELPAKDQVLHIDLTGRDPDDNMTDVPYEKGAAFLRRLEQLYGRPRFDAFLRGWFDGHAFRSVTTADFTDYLSRELLSKDADLAKQVDVRAWVQNPGLPKDAPVPESAAFARVDGLTKAFLETGTLGEAAKAWSTQEWLRFLNGLPEKLPANRMQDFQKLGIAGSGNSEIRAAASLVLIHNLPGDSKALDGVDQFLLSVGRRKFLKPLYEELAKTKEGKARARAIYQQARPRYHSVSQRTIDQILGWPW
jgi:aminopeptidase N